MSMYYYRKKKIGKNDVHHIYLHFDNGDFVTLAYCEIFDISLRFYDRLIAEDRGFTPVAASGYIKVKLINKERIVNLPHEVANEEEYLKDRRKYLTERFLRENGTREIWLFNRNNWHYAIRCHLEAKQEEDCLILSVLPQPTMGDSVAERHTIDLLPPNEKSIEQIDIDFENCESFFVYEEEIVECQLELAPTLEWNAFNLSRKVVGGYLILNLRCRSRKQYLFWDKQGHPKKKDFLYRLCGKTGESDVDICHLYITYHGPGYCLAHEECLELDSIYACSDEASENDLTIKASDDDYDDFEDEDFDPFVSGYCKLLKGDVILIAFGLNAKETIKQRLKRR